MKEEILRILLKEDDMNTMDWLKSMVDGMYEEPYEEVIRQHTENYEDEITEIGDHYGMTVYEIDSEEYAIAPLYDMDDYLHEYYQNLVDDIGYSELGMDLTEYISMGDADRRMFATDEADSYTDDMDDEELLENANLTDTYDEYEETISGLTEKLEELEEDDEEDEERLEHFQNNFDDMDDDDDDYDMLEGLIEELETKIEEKTDEIDNIKERISTLEGKKESLVDGARDSVHDSYYEEFYECLEDLVECLVNDRGWYDSVDDLVESNMFWVDDEAIVDDMAQNGDFGEMNHYDGDYQEIEDSTGTTWIIMRTD